MAPESITLVTSVNPNVSDNAVHSLDIRVIDIKAGTEMPKLTFPGRTQPITSGRSHIP